MLKLVQPYVIRVVKGGLILLRAIFTLTPAFNWSLAKLLHRVTHIRGQDSEGRELRTKRSHLT